MSCEKKLSLVTPYTMRKYYRKEELDRIYEGIKYQREMEKGLSLMVLEYNPHRWNRTL